MRDLNMEEIGQVYGATYSAPAPYHAGENKGKNSNYGKNSYKAKNSYHAKYSNYGKNSYKYHG